jgi:alpha,alpha-trehalase
VVDTTVHRTRISNSAVYSGDASVSYLHAAGETTLFKSTIPLIGVVVHEWVRWGLCVTSRTNARALLFALALLCCTTNAKPSLAQLPACALESPPSELLGELFTAVQSQRLFKDSKTFADLHSDESPVAILKEYKSRKDEASFDLRAFVHQHFSLPPEGPTVPSSSPGESIDAYVRRLWGVLTHESKEISQHSSLMPLPHPYVVPGGRFRELYYWDSYFTMLGLEADDQHDPALSMLKNFAFQIDCYGHVPNGNRTYYLSRSQPPFFSLMIDLIAEREGQQSYVTYLPELETEYRYWMDGSAVLSGGQSYRRVVQLKDGSLLNRYWDDRAAPRDESYREDVETALAHRRDPADLYRNIRAAAESGWDFSSRWLADGQNLSSIRTVSLLPVDLNCLMAHLERTLAKAYRIAGYSERSTRFLELADKRETAIRQFMWNERSQMFADYDWEKNEIVGQPTAAGLFPLFFRIATERQAKMVARTVRDKLIFPGGIATTLIESGQQWDYPNGWAPLQWVSVIGLKNYDEGQLAETIARRWSCENIDNFQMFGTLFEKYNLVHDGPGGGGEYALQIGFGWTNGVLRAFSSLYGTKSEQLCKRPSAE